MTLDRQLRRAVLATCVTGALASGTVFALTYAEPIWMERAAGTWLARQAARELGIEESSGGPQSLEPMVDELMGGLPGRAKELKVVRPLRSPDAARG